MNNFENIRIHRSIAAGIGAFAGSVDFFTGIAFGVCWLIGEIISFVVFGNETNQ
jgi:hypothetical protein